MRKKLLLSSVLALSAFTGTEIVQSSSVLATEMDQKIAPSASSKHVELKLPTTGSLSIEVVRSPETEKRAQLHDQAKKLLDSQNFDKLEELGNQLCKDKTTGESGNWLIDAFISGLDGSTIDDNKPDSTWEKQLTALKQWEETKPNSILAKTALMSFWTRYAWKARGSGWANTVTDEGWRSFEERLKKAQALMDKADSLAQTCPTLYREKLILARGNSWKREQMETAFAKCIKLFPTYTAAYAYKYAYLMPRWGGEQGEGETFLMESADKRGKGTESDKFYALLIWNLEMHRFLDQNSFAQTELSWEKTKAGFDALLKENPNSLILLSEYAKIADLADDKSKCKELFNKLGNRCEAGIWGGRDGWQKWRFNEAKEHALSSKKYSDQTKDDQ